MEPDPLRELERQVEAGGMFSHAVLAQEANRADQNEAIIRGLVELLIQREVDLPISLNLFVKPGTTLRDITTVLSYPHAIAQCRTWLSKKLPDATIVAANSCRMPSKDPGRSLRWKQTMLVLSWPVGAGIPRPTTTKRVWFSGWSSMSLASRWRP